MKAMNKRGITLVELLTVLIVLILIFLMAIIKVNDVMDDAEQKSIKADAISYVKAVNDFFTIGNGVSLNPIYEGFYTYQELYDIGVKVSGTKPVDGYVVNGNNKTIHACLQYKNMRALIEDDKVVSVDNKTCKLKNGYNENIDSYLEGYTGTEKTFNVKVSGKYKVEVWGAQGGSYDDTYYGGYGSYSFGYVDLEKDDVLYINVGGKGVDLNKIVYGTNPGGYNGGGDSYSITNNCGNYAGSGGGATSIAYASGLLKNLNVSDVLIVAGGGGGSNRRHCHVNDYNYENGGSAGGYIGSSKTVQYGLYGGSIAMGGTQDSGGLAGTTGSEDGYVDGSFGQGGQSARTGGYTNSAGGGGGFYGGGNGMFVGAAGGSGYIGNANLIYGAMYCYECKENDENEYKTVSTEAVFEEPIQYSAKKNNGYARIVLIEKNNLNND